MALKDRIFTRAEILAIRMEGCDDDAPYLPAGWAGTLVECLANTGAPEITRMWGTMVFFEERETFRLNRAVLNAARLAFGSSPSLVSQSLTLMADLLQGTATVAQLRALHLLVADEKQSRWEAYRDDITSAPKRDRARLAACAFFATSPPNAKHKNTAFAAILNAYELTQDTAPLLALVATVLNNHP